jgi:hypothetical protein
MNVEEVKYDSSDHFSTTLSFYIYIVLKVRFDYQEIDGGVPAPAQLVRTRLGGRKMMIKGEGLKGDDSKIEGSAQYSVGNCTDGAKGILNVSRKVRKSGPRAMDVKIAGFAALNADYHVPKPHPPKNN